MTSKQKSAKNAYVWIWLPDEAQPIVAGLIEKFENKYLFVYGKSYLERSDAIPLSPFELPLQSGTFTPGGMNNIHSCLRDGAPDAWGRRVINHEYPDLNADELDFMLLSGSNRIGALDFQHSSKEYEPRIHNRASLAELLQAAECLERGESFSTELGKALLQGSSIGGARPKCLIEDKNIQYIAKFSLSTDYYKIIQAEYIAMRLASFVSINVPNVSLKRVLDKTVLLVERFDRNKNNHHRLHMLSGLSILGLNELEARYASYIELADIIRSRFEDPKFELLELYKRLIFNVLIGNTDDHARNTSAFWDGKKLVLTPAYDLCPQVRAGGEATQAMAIEGIQNNHSTLVNVLSVHQKFMIDRVTAQALINAQISIIKDKWAGLCEEADLSQ